MVNISVTELSDAVRNITDHSPYKIVISNRRSRAGTASDLNEARMSEKSAGSEENIRIYEKIIITPCIIKNSVMFQAGQFTRTQAFHRNMRPEEVNSYIVSLLSEEFRQLDAFSENGTFNIKISKKGKILTSFSDKGIRKSCIPENKQVPFPRISGETAAPAHNRRKKRLLEEGTVIPPLIDMGIFTKEGKLIRGMSDKFRQINRFIEIVDDAVDACGMKSLNIVDFGCGKAYLTFILYYYLTYIKKIPVSMTGLDLKADVIRDCRRTAEKYGYTNLRFETGDVSTYTSDNHVDMVITLHACDTATDYALFNAIKWGSRVILSVPCCQHELNSQIQSSDFSVLTKYGIIKERFAALATDALRASLLEYSGYKTQVLEFVDLSHTPKNLLIRAVKTNLPSDKKERSLREAEAFIGSFNADPALYRLLTDKEE